MNYVPAEVETVVDQRGELVCRLVKPHVIDGKSYSNLGPYFERLIQDRLEPLDRYANACEILTAIAGVEPHILDLGGGTFIPGEAYWPVFCWYAYRRWRFSNDPETRHCEPIAQDVDRIAEGKGA